MERRNGKLIFPPLDGYTTEELQVQAVRLFDWIIAYTKETHLNRDVRAVIRRIRKIEAEVRRRNGDVQQESGELDAAETLFVTGSETPSGGVIGRDGDGGEEDVFGEA